MELSLGYCTFNWTIEYLILNKEETFELPSSSLLKK